MPSAPRVFLALALMFFGFVFFEEKRGKRERERERENERAIKKEERDVGWVGKKKKLKGMPDGTLVFFGGFSLSLGGRALLK